MGTACSISHISGMYTDVHSVIIILYMYVTWLSEVCVICRLEWQGLGNCLQQ